MRVIGDEIINVGDLVHLHHNQPGACRWGHVSQINVENGILIDIAVGMVDGWPSVMTVASCYVNKALLGLNGPLCLRCEREARQVHP